MGEALEENARLKKTMEAEGKMHVKVVMEEVLEPLAQSLFGVETFKGMEDQEAIRTVNEALENMSVKIGV